MNFGSGCVQTRLHSFPQRTGVGIRADGSAQAVIGQDRLFRRPQADQQPSVGEPLSQAAQQVAQMRWCATQFEVAKADHGDAFTVQRADMGARGCLVLQDTGFQAILVQQLGQHAGGAGIQRAAAGDAEDGRPGAPGRWKGVRVDGARRGVLGQVLLAARRRGCGAAHGIVALRFLVVVLVQVVDQFLHRGLDFFELRAGEHTAFGVDGGELQSFQGDLIVVGGQRAVA